MPLTEYGFARQTYSEILAAKIARAQEYFGADIDTSEQTPLGKYIRINAYDQARAEEEIEAVYYARFPNSATGVSLDRLCVFAGITRNPAIPAKYNVTANGTEGATIAAGFIVATDTGITFYNISNATIGAGGSCTLSVACTQAGIIGNVDSADINIIVNPNANVTSVVGTTCTKSGEEEETDVALRKRFAAAIQGAGSNNEPAIRSAILRVPTVESVGVVVNDTDATDSGGRPARSFECYVTGGDEYEQQIAETIYDKKPIGIKTYGTVTKTVTDDGGFEHTIQFSHTAEITVSVYVKIKKNAAYESDGDDQIETNIQNYIDSLSVGQDVIFSSLYGYIYNVAGVTEVTELKLSTDGGTTKVTTNITISDTQIARGGEVSVQAVT